MDGPQNYVSQCEEGKATSMDQLSHHGNIAEAAEACSNINLIHFCPILCPLPLYLTKLLLSLFLLRFLARLLCLALLSL